MFLQRQGCWRSRRRLRCFKQQGGRSGRPLLVVEGLQKRFGNARACDDVSFSLHEGEILGVVGESGSGKTTLARCIVGLVQPDAGVIAVNGERVAGRVQGRKREVLEALQMVFQNPDSTLNPRHTTRRVLSRGCPSCMVNVRSMSWPGRLD